MKKPNKNKTTESFKVLMFNRDIWPHLKLHGSKTFFPYRLNGEMRFASISYSDVFKIIKWDRKTTV